MKLILALLVALLPFAARAQTIDYSIADQTFPSVRTDLNAHLGAIVRHNAGTTAPATTFPYQVWVDTSGAVPVYKYRNAANSAWITAFQIDASAAAWLGGVTTANATITGGSINGTTIGVSTPASGAFTTLTTTGNATLSSTQPGLYLNETDGTATHRQTVFFQAADAFQIGTANSAQTFVASDYVIAKGATGATSHSFRVAGTERLAVSSTGISVTGSIGATSSISAAGGSTSRFGNLHAQNDSSILGRPHTSAIDGALNGFRWQAIYLQTAPNVSSDARLKHDIGDITAAECRVADRIEIKRYRLNSEADGPWRFGAIAQEVIAAFDAEGLDWRDYAVVTGSEADTYGVAYDELQNLKLACM
jgi:hypothetical protein